MLAEGIAEPLPGCGLLPDDLAPRLDFTIGHIRAGLPDLRAGRAVQIANLDSTLNGRWFIKETTHTINDNGYRTTFVARREVRS